MIPEMLIPVHFHISRSEPADPTAQNNADLTQGKISLADYDNDILAAPGHRGQSRNMLQEERDRHIQERLFHVLKIETYARVLNALQREGEIDFQELSQIISTQTEKINAAGNEIWLNLITREKTTALFYDFQAD